MGFPRHPGQAHCIPGGGDPWGSSWGTQQMPRLLVGTRSVLILEAAGDGTPPPAGSARSWKVPVPFSTALHPPGTPDCSGPHLLRPGDLSYPCHWTTAQSHFSEKPCVRKQPN